MSASTLPSRPRSASRSTATLTENELLSQGMSMTSLQRLGLAAAVSAGLTASVPGLLHERITGLDQAHHIASSLFFHDAFRDLPLTNPLCYVYDYYRQYPALGFVFWPPVFHAAAGAVMTVVGPGVFAARLTLALFTALLAGCFYLCVRRCAPPLIALLATGVLLTVPLMIELENSVMLEIPMAAMVCLTLVAYFRLIDRGRWIGWGEVLLASVLCAGIVHTKQPGVFLLPALWLDLAWNHRPLLRDRRTWVLMGLVVLWCLPLALFTLKFGRVNLAQSFGNQGNIYVAAHHVADRWSIAGWTYYLREAPAQVNGLLCLLAMAGGVAVCWQRELRRRQGVWVAYILCWYLLFTLFDNKQPRFVSAVVPGVVALATVCLCSRDPQTQRRGRRPRISSWLWKKPAVEQSGGPPGLSAEGADRRSVPALRLAFAAGLLAVLLADQGGEAHIHVPQGYPGLKELTASLVQPELDGNLVFFGADYQLFMPWVRLLDPTQRVAVLRGDDLLAAAGSLSRALEAYRARYVLVDPESPPGVVFQAAVGEQLPATLQHRRRFRFDNGHKSFEVDLYAYTGPLADEMAQVPLASQVHDLRID